MLKSKYRWTHWTEHQRPSCTLHYWFQQTPRWVSAAHFQSLDMLPCCALQETSSSANQFGMEDGASEAQIRLSHCARVHRKQRRSDYAGGLAYEDLLDRHLGSLCMDYGLQFLPLLQTRISSLHYVQCLHCFELSMNFIARGNLKHSCLLHSKLQLEMVPPLMQMVKHHLPFYLLLELVVVLIQQIETFKSAYLLYEVFDQ